MCRCLWLPPENLPDPFSWTRLDSCPVLIPCVSCSCSASPGSRRQLVWSSHVDPSRLVPVSLAPPAPAGKLAWSFLVDSSRLVSGARTVRLRLVQCVSWLLPETRVVLSRGPVPVRAGVSGSPRSRRRLAWSSLLDLSWLVPASVALLGALTVRLLAPAGNSFGPLTWTPSDSCLCLWLPGSCRKLVWSSLVDPYRLVPVSLALPGACTVSLAPPGNSYGVSPVCTVRLLAPAGPSSGPLSTWARPGSCRCLWLLRLLPETRLVLSRGPVPTRAVFAALPGTRTVCFWLPLETRLVPVSLAPRFPPVTRLVLSLGPVLTRAGVSGSSRYSCSVSPSRAGITQLTPLVAFPTLAVVGVALPELPSLAQMSCLACRSRSLTPCTVDSSRGVCRRSRAVAAHSSLAVLVDPLSFAIIVK